MSCSNMNLERWRGTLGFQICSWPFVLLIALTGPAAPLGAQEPRPVYVRVRLHDHLVDFAQKENRLKEVAERIIQAIQQRGFSPQFCWDLKAVAPSEPQEFPEFVIVVRPEVNQRNWYMQVQVRTGAEDASLKELEPRLLLKPGDIELGNYPAGPARRERLVEWFLEHFVVPGGSGSLREILWERVPVGRGHLALKTTPALKPGEGVILLSHKRFWPLGESVFRFVARQQSQLVKKEPFEGLAGFREVVAAGGTPAKVLLMQFKGQPGDLQDLTEGLVFLKEYRYATSPELLLADD